MSQTTGALAIFTPGAEAREFAIKVGTTTKNVLAETLMVLGGKQAGELMREAGYALAVHKAQHGNYRAAVEIVSLAASKALLKVCAPQEGGTWNKASTMFLCQKVLEVKPKEGKGFGPKVLKGRVMAQTLIDLFEGKDAPKNPTGPATDASERSDDPLSTPPSGTDAPF